MAETHELAVSMMPAGDRPIPRIPDFDLLRPIGEGGFGEVWLAVNCTTRQPRAVKLIPRRRSGDKDPAGREVTSLTRLEANVRCRHPSLLLIHHVGQTAQHLFYVMDLADDVAGGPGSAEAGYRPATLKSRLEHGPLPPDECRRSAQQLLAALACLHRSGMVHRDVKPANCLFVGGELKLADFGLLTESDVETSRLGTQPYMPPDGCMDVRADVFAAGLVIYQTYSGQPVERFPSLGEASQGIAGNPILARLNRLVLRACDPDPERRFPDAAAMLAELEAAEAPIGPRPALARRPAVWAAVAAALVACILGIVFWPGQVPRVDVNFITHPYEATILLDGELLLDADGMPYRTPCTVPGIPARVHRVTFQFAGLGERPLGEIDLRQTREIVARWPGKR